MTTQTKTTKTVTLGTINVGTHFGTVGVLKTRGGKVIASCDRTRPYGFCAAALDDARALADKMGYRIAEAE